jgi:hypothetical protein
MIVVIMKMKFRIKKCSHVFNGVGPGYSGLTKFIITDQYIGFPGEGYNFSFTGVEFN